MCCKDRPATNRELKPVQEVSMERLRILASYSPRRSDSPTVNKKELARVMVQEPRGCDGCTVSATMLGMVLP
jgi:hypothetical protein